MKNKRAKQMIEDLTAPDEWGFKHLPWIDNNIYWCGEDYASNRDSRILRKVKKIVSNEVYDDIKEFIKESECGFRMDITFNSGGHEQSEEGYAFEVAYVDQYSNGGMSGDEFAGQVWIPITPKRFFTFHYSM